MDEKDKVVDAGAEATVEPTETKENISLEGLDLDQLFETEEVKKRVQSISDKRVTEALRTAKDNWTRELEDMKDEAKKLQKMTKEEKERYEFEKQKEEFAKQKADFEHGQLQLQTAKQLLEVGLPDLSAYITAKDAETTAENIKSLSSILSEWKQGLINESLAGNAPKDPTPQKTITRDELSKMTRAEINAAFNAGLLDTSKL
jgi:hypothetical protein